MAEDVIFELGNWVRVKPQTECTEEDPPAPCEMINKETRVLSTRYQAKGQVTIAAGDCWQCRMSTKCLELIRKDEA